MSSFFTIPGAQKKRKRPSAPDAPKKRVAAPSLSRRPNAKPTPVTKKTRVERDESISGSDSEDSDGHRKVNGRHAADDDSEGSEAEDETQAEKRLRLAERYLQNVREEVDEVFGFDAEEIDRDLIAERLEEDAAAAKGKVYRNLAADLAFDLAESCAFRWNSGNVNAVAVCAPYAYTVSSDIYLTKWRIQDLPKHQWPQTTKRKPKKAPAPPKRKPERIRYFRGFPHQAKNKSYQGHTGKILCVAASEDGKFVVTGGEDWKLIVWDAETLKPLRVFTSYPHREAPHRDAAVTGVAFQKGRSNQLYSCSKDGTVKVWGINELSYIQTLYGHGDAVADIDGGLAQERCVSVGSRDRTARLWKIIEETQLTFQGGTAPKHPPPGVDPKSLAEVGSVDRVAMLDDELFVTGSMNGSITLWTISRKKPLFVLPHAHGLERHLALTEASAEKNPDPAVVPPPQPRWITALRTIPYTNVILSGSWDGYIRVFRLSEDKKKLERLGVLGGKEEIVSRGESGKDDADGEEAAAARPHNASNQADAPRVITGVVNDIAVFERGERGRDGLCVVAAVGKEYRMGRWQTIPRSKNGALVFEVPRALTNGVQGVLDGEAADDDL